MKLLIVDPNVSLTSPSMKGVVRSLPRFKEQGFEIEVWCWYCDEGLPIDRIVKLPALGRLHTIGGYVFALWARLRSWWLFQKKRQPRPDLVYTIAWYLPDCDVCHVQFSPFDWELRQRVLGIKSLRDVYERVVNLVTLVMARHFLKTTTARLFIPASDAVANDLREEGWRPASRCCQTPTTPRASMKGCGRCIVRRQGNNSTCCRVTGCLCSPAPVTTVARASSWRWRRSGSCASGTRR
ncbi:hypothetical protein [Verrucomicrobium spinosum]|uniref:hypothetical protein n=1 Tax=Verrucomicrobium spinosum TaxID=2736 RepID=UPI000AF301D8|nr:hypothetical protein [Verrucomicrobium spinosum]